MVVGPLEPRIPTPEQIQAQVDGYMAQIEALGAANDWHPPEDRFKAKGMMDGGS